MFPEMPGAALPLGRSAEGTATLGVRPEHITLAECTGAKFADLRVDLVENLGGQTVVYATTTDGQAITVVLEGQRQVEIGSTVSAYVDPAKAHVFNAEGNALR
mgnify:CR=1 FL=1